MVENNHSANPTWEGFKCLYLAMQEDYEPLV